MVTILGGVLVVVVPRQRPSVRTGLAVVPFAIFSSSAVVELSHRPVLAALLAVLGDDGRGNFGHVASLHESLAAHSGPPESRTPHLRFAGPALYPDELAARGACEVRTRDLLNAIETRYQLR